MKILHIVAGDLTGGAARGAYWLHLGLLELGVDSKIFTNSKTLFDDNAIISVNKTKKDKFLNLLRMNIDPCITSCYPKRKKVIFSTGLFGVNFTKTQYYKEADIIHLHWICGGFVNIKHLKKINKPIVWTLRDMWPMTGGCHFSMDCTNYETGCGNCLQLNSNTKYDLSKYILKRKINNLPKNIHIVGISNWMSDQARTSKLFNSSPVSTIFNNINTKEFFPTSKKNARTIVNIQTDKKVVLVGAAYINDYYKGFSKYLEALAFLDRSKYFLCFFGNLNKKILQNIEFDYYCFGFLTDNVSLRLVYNCADVFVAPSVMEAFGKTLVESMACGTPVVCFDATGPKDIVSHKIDGYKAKPFDSEDLARGIEWVLYEANYNELCKNAREKAVCQFDSVKIAKEYIDLYRCLLGNTA
jgi:glycosyltransferase involved in cell wall biosynthesis